MRELIFFNGVQLLFPLFGGAHGSFSKAFFPTPSHSLLAELKIHHLKNKILPRTVFFLPRQQNSKNIDFNSFAFGTIEPYGFFLYTAKLYYAIVPAVGGLIVPYFVLCWRCIEENSNLIELIVFGSFVYFY